jgi:hypothetical protein
MNLSKEEISLLRESFLFEEVEKLCFPQHIQKTAGLFETLGLSSVQNFLQDFSSRYIKDSSETPGGYITSMLNVLSAGVLFRINPILGAIYLALDAFGYNISDMAKKLVKYLKPKLEEKGEVSSKEINEAAASLFGGMGEFAISMADDGIVASASKESISEIIFEEILKEASLIEGIDKIAAQEIEKTAIGWQDEVDKYYKSKYYGKGTPGSPFLFGGGKEVPIIQRIFGNLFNRPNGASRLKWFGVGIVAWIVKSLFAGALLLSIGRGVSKLIGLPDPKDQAQKEEPSTKSEIENPFTFAEKEEKEERKEKEEQISPSKNSGLIWVVPLVGSKTVKDTIRIWTLDLYLDSLYEKYLKQGPKSFEELMKSDQFKVESKISEAIKRSPKFNSIVNGIEMYIKDSKGTGFEKLRGNQLVMPKEYSSISQVVNQFIDEVEENLKKGIK